MRTRAFRAIDECRRCGRRAIILAVLHAGHTVSGDRIDGDVILGDTRPCEAPAVHCAPQLVGLLDVDRLTQAIPPADEAHEWRHGRP